MDGVTQNQQGIEIIPAPAAPPAALDGASASLPAIITASGPAAPERFLEFFAANIRNSHTRRAYARQVMQFLF